MMTDTQPTAALLLGTPLGSEDGQWRIWLPSTDSSKDYTASTGDDLREFLASALSVAWDVTSQHPRS